MTSQEFEKRLRELLEQRLASSDDKGLNRRRQQLVELFTSLDNTGAVTGLLVRLAKRIDADGLSRLFHDRLHSATREQLLDILHTPAKHTNTVHAGKSSDETEPRFRLVDEATGRERTIAKSDPEYLEKFIDFHIREFTVDPDPRTLEHHTGVVHYTDGRSLHIPLHELPANCYIAPDYGPAATARFKFMDSPSDYYILRRGTIIPVDHNGQLSLHRAKTPNLIDFATTAYLNMRLRGQKLELSELVAAFAERIASIGGMLDFGISVTPRPGGGHRVAPKSPSRHGGGSNGGSRPPDNGSSGGGSRRPFIVRVKFKKVTALVMLAWEKMGGHTLRHHNWQKTRKMLFDRVAVGAGEIPAPQMQKGRVKPADFRVWNKDNKSAAASRWADETTMHKTIGDLIDANIDAIRSHTAGGKPFVIEKISVGHRTGDGWISTVSPKGERAASWYDNLGGVKIVIRPRDGHIATDTDPEGWYVHTAYPDFPIPR